jgi:hypothetical protein
MFWKKKILTITRSMNGIHLGQKLIEISIPIHREKSLSTTSNGKRGESTYSFRTPEEYRVSLTVKDGIIESIIRTEPMNTYNIVLKSLKKKYGKPNVLMRDFMIWSDGQTSLLINKVGIFFSVSLR